MLAFLQKHLDDILGIAGSGLIVYGTSLLNLVAAYYVAGAFCLGAAALVAISRKGGTP